MSSRFESLGDLNRQNFNDNIPDETKLAVGQLLAKYFNEPKYENAVGKSIDVTDTSGNLIMVHYKDNVDMTIYGRVRGIVIAIDEYQVIADSYGTIAHVDVSTQIGLPGCPLEIDFPKGDATDVYNYEDVDGNQYSFKKAKTVFKHGFDGTIIRTFYHNGKYMVCTHRRLNAYEANYPGIDNFEKLANYLGMPTVHELYGNITSGSSPYVYTFMLVHDNLSMVSKDLNPTGFIVYMGSKKMYEADCVEAKLQFLVNEISDYRPFRYAHPAISSEEMLKRLDTGFHAATPEVSDHRQKLGETVFAINYDDNNNVVKILKLCAPEYIWRANIRNNNVNLFKQFCYMLNVKHYFKITGKGKLTFTSAATKTLYLKRFMVFAKNEELRTAALTIKSSTIKLTKPILKLNTTTELVFTIDDYIYQMWLNLLMAVPIVFQAQVFMFYKIYTDNLSALMMHLMDLNMMPLSEREYKKVPKRINDILTQANANKKTSKLTPMEIKYILNVENGLSIYKMKSYFDNLAK